jgi:hypothetical protein
MVCSGAGARTRSFDLREGFSLRTLDNRIWSDIVSTNVALNTAFVLRTCSHTEPLMPAYARRDIVDEDRVGVVSQDAALG